MIKLRVVGYSDDLENLILAKKGSRRGTHLTAIDDRMFDVLEEVWRERKAAERGEKRAAREAPAEVDSKLPPREVQRLLRAGHTPSEVAHMAGVDVSWVEKFYSMVLHERAGVINDMQTLWLEKPKLGSSGLPLGEAVLANLRSRHVRLDDDQFAESWDATRQDGQPWLVSLEFSFRGRKQRATWRYDPHRRTVAAANRLGADLGWVKNGRKAAAHVASAQRSVTKKTPAKKTPVKRTAVKRTAVKRAAVKRAAAKRPAAKRGGARKRAPAKKAARRTVSRRRPVARKRSTARRPAKRTPARRAAAKRSPGRRASARRSTRRR